MNTLLTLTLAAINTITFNGNYYYITEILGNRAHSPFPEWRFK